MTISDEQLRSKREFIEEMIADSKANLEQGEVPQDRVHLVYSSLGGDYRDLGLYSALLDEEATAREQFATAVDYYLSGIRRARERKDEIKRGNRESEPSRLLTALYTALLSNDNDRLTEAARETLAMDAEYVTEFPDTAYKYYAAKAVAAVILDVDEAESHLRALQDGLDDLRPELRQFFGGIAGVVDGILANDAKTVADGVQRLLANHSSSVQGEPTNPNDAVSLPATAMVALARKHGVDVPIESEYFLPRIEGLD